MFLKLRDESGATVLVNTDRVTTVDGFLGGSFIHVAGKDLATKVAEPPDEVYQAYIDQQTEQVLAGVKAATANMMEKLCDALDEADDEVAEVVEVVEDTRD